MRYRMWCLFFGTVLVAAGTTAAAQDPALVDGKPVSAWVEQLKLGRSGGNFQIFEKIGTAAVPMLPSFVELLKHADYEVRIVTALAVREVAKAVVRAQRRGTPTDRAGLNALKPVAQALVPLLADADPKDTQELVASRAQWALQEMGNVGVEELTAAARDKTKSVMVRARAIQSLGDIGPAATDSLAVLRALFGDKTEDALVRGESNAAIKKIERTPQ